MSKVRTNKVSLDIRISKLRRVQSDLTKIYGIKQYLDPAQFSFSPKMEQLIPRNIPNFVDHGENYIKRIARALSFFKQCAIIGPSGTGKTHAVYLTAQIAELPLWEINCSLQTSVFDLFGRYVGLGKENWIDGLITSWTRYGGILYLDEANMMKQDVATRLNPLLDARGHMVLSEKDNEMIPRHKDAHLILSMNPFSAEFVGTKPLNAALRRRMSVWINFDYMSTGDHVDEKEVSLISQNTGINTYTAEKIANVAAKLRKEYKEGDLPYAPSVGDLINWARLMADGSSIMESCNETIIAMISDDKEIQEDVKNTVHKVFGPEVR